MKPAPEVQHELTFTVVDCPEVLLGLEHVHGGWLARNWHVWALTVGAVALGGYLGGLVVGLLGLTMAPLGMAICGQHEPVTDADVLSTDPAGQLLLERGTLLLRSRQRLLRDQAACYPEEYRAMQREQTRAHGARIPMMRWRLRWAEHVKAEVHAAEEQRALLASLREPGPVAVR